MRHPHAAAFISVVAAGPALADDPDAISLYGRVYVTAEVVEARKGDSRAPAIARTSRVSDQSSAIGIRGVERLGEGTRAFFQLETAFRADQNNTAFAARNSAVGMRGGYGSVLLGRWDAPLKAATLAIDAFDDLTLGGVSAALNGSGIAGVQGGFDRRDTNVLQYWSPEESPTKLRASVTANEGRGPFANPRNAGLSLVWSRGPWLAGYAYDEMRDQAFNSNDALPRQQAHAVIAKWDSGRLRIAAAVERIRRSGFSDQSAALASLAWSSGPSRFVYQYQRARRGRELRDVGPAPVANDKILVVANVEPACDVHALAWIYRWSPRTMGLAQYVRIHNNATASCNFGANPLALQREGGEQPRGFALGLRQVF